MISYPLIAEELTHALGGKWTRTQGTARCPAHDDHNPSLSISENPSGGNSLVHCHAGCSQDAVIDALKRMGLWASRSKKETTFPTTRRTTKADPDTSAPNPEPQAQTKEIPQEKTKAELAQEIWDAASPATDSKVSVYLESRGITIQPPDSLRFHPDLKHSGSDKYFPAMVTQVTDSITGEAMGIHRTFLAHDGNGKAPVDPAKMMLGKVKGGVVRLGEPGDDGVLMVGEGIETCLSVMQATGHPVWVALSTSNLKNLELPPGLSKAILLADGDKAGEDAAQAAADRWVEDDESVDIMGQEKRPDVLIAKPPPKKDFNDLLQEPNGEEIITSAINNAEEIESPLKNLTEKAQKNPGAPFEPKVINAILRLLKKPNGQAEFERLRSDLKSTNCRVTELDKIINKKLGIGRKQTQVEILEEIVKKHEKEGTLETFRPANALKDAYVNVRFTSDEIDETTGTNVQHRKTFRAPGDDLSSWLTIEFFNSTGKAPNADTLKAVMNRLEAKAKDNSPCYSIFLRVGHFEEKSYIDLSDEMWGAIEIDESGWRKINEPPICFHRTDEMTPLPEPIKDGSDEKGLAALRSFLNVKSEDDFILAVFWLLAALRPEGPYPVLVVSGEQGSAKSTFAKTLRALIDPNKAPLRSLPRNDEDLIIAAHNSHALVFDNVSGFSGEISDAICRIATGAGHGKRKLYTDNTEVIFDGSRQIILNGITDFVTRPDLADRSIPIELKPIPSKDRRLEKDLWDDFNKEKPRILGALFKAMAGGLARFPAIQMTELPRMADFAKWSMACETAFWPEGTYKRVSEASYSRSLQTVLDNDVVANALQQHLKRYSGSWNGTPTSLLTELTGLTDDGTTRSKIWPKSPSQLTGRLKRLAPILRDVGITVEHSRRGHEGTREVSITTSTSSADDADDKNAPTFLPSKGGISSIPPFSDSKRIEEVSSASSASSKNTNKTLIYKDKKPRENADDTADDTPLADDGCRQQRSKTAGNCGFWCRKRGC